MKQVSRRLSAAVALCGLFGSGGLFATGASAASATRTSSFACDATSGQLIQEVIEPGTAALRLEADYVYDGFGNKTSATVSGVDIASRTATSTYDARGQFAAINANELGQSESLQFDARFGVPSSQTDLNGLTTTWSYDSLGRKILEVRPDGTQTKWAYLFCSGVSGGTQTCPPGGAYLVQATPLASDGCYPERPARHRLLRQARPRDCQRHPGL